MSRKKHNNGGFRFGLPWFAPRGKRGVSGESVDQANNQQEQVGGIPNPAAGLPTLDEREQNILHRVGHAWGRVCTSPEVWKQALPIDPDLGSYPTPQSLRPNRFEQFVRVSQRDVVEATQAAEEPASWLGRRGSQIRHSLLGAPLRSTALVQERMRKLVALPVLSADALSSIAYGPEAMLTILVLAGSAGLNYIFPLAAAIAFLMFAVGVSYRQTIRAYPHGGGSYIVANENLGHLPGLAAAAGLLADYILTVAISIASGVAAITSAIPPLAPATALIGISVIAVLLAGNLRGVRQAGILFAAPTYLFLLAMFVLIIVGVAGAAGRSFHPLPAPSLSLKEGVSLLLILRAFASGSTAMTGIEAVSNAVPAFRPIEWCNARTTLTWMIGLLIMLFAGTIAVIHLDGVVPKGSETVLSQLARSSFGTGWWYFFTQAATAAILLLAANTAYNDFPRVLFLLARDGYVPRIFLRLGDRLAFSNGILLLSIAAALIYLVFGGKTDPLIPLFAVGVFLAFTLSQAGMVVHWWRLRTAHWRRSLCFNTMGSLLSAIVFLTAGITKFTAGAWIVILAIGLFMLMALRIRHHYDQVKEELKLRPGTIEVPKYALSPVLREKKEQKNGGLVQGEETANDTASAEETPEALQHLTLVPLASLDRASMRALAYAASLQQPVLALHLSPSEEEAERFRTYWQVWGDHLPLEVVVSPYRALVVPLVHYIRLIHIQRPDLTVTVILPEIVVRHWWHRLLHNRTASRLRRALRPLPKMVVTTVPFHLSS